jgi:4-hydroxybenzoyl-CoA reductase subunit beta
MLRLPRFSYLRPGSVAEAARMLADHGGRAMLMAGGTDLLPKMKRRQMAPEVLVGLSHLRELREARTMPDGRLELGAGVTLAAVQDARGTPHAYAQAARLVSSPALRNVGTIGGNLCLDTRCNYYDRSEEWREAIGFCLKTGGEVCQVATSSPRCWAVSSSDTAPVAVALGATAVLVGPDGEREVPVAALYRDDGIAYLAKEPTEVLSHLRLPAPDAWRSSYAKLRRRGSFDFPLAGAAVALQLDGRRVERCRLVLGAVASHPVEVPAVASLLEGRELDEEAIVEAAAEAAKPAKPLDNADANYVWRKRMVKVIVERALREAAALA